MKKLLLLLTVILITTNLNATIINVDSDPNRPTGYYGDLQLALNNASPGDSIYLYPSNNSYGTITIEKQIHIFGVGFVGSSGGSLSRIGNINLDSSTTVSGNPSGSSFQGLYFSSLSCQRKNITNIIVSGNEFSTISLQYNCSGWLIVNNLLSGYISVNNNSSMIITNNIFRSSTYGISSSNSTSVIISHNMFFYWQNFNSVHNAIISDNIFMFNTATPTSSSMSHNVFNNNLGWRSALNPAVLPPEGNSGSGNIPNQDPLFETGPSNTSYDYTKDYHLQSTSPGKNAASDGSDIGIYGGSTPFVWGGIYSIPKITMTNITNPVINQSTPINVNIKAKKAGL
ncbi:MAG: hypothetical protein DRI86_09535 [Bacteroidetes bacterium]|nr:MAG: hypothetical protein DRI86_09535 [Bacteroidota bacterium]